MMTTIFRRMVKFLVSKKNVTIKKRKNKKSLRIRFETLNSSFGLIEREREREIFE
mgnify:CR=1 FL=1